MKMTEGEMSALLSLADQPGFKALRKQVSLRIEEAVSKEAEARGEKVLYWAGAARGMSWMADLLDALSARSDERQERMDAVNGEGRGLMDRLKARVGG